MSTPTERAVDQFKGVSSYTKQLKGDLLRVAQRDDLTVLIQGATGTGKELAAQIIHQEGSRKDGPFVAVDCGAIPENLLESELFGHVKGAFTDAHADRTGAIEAAEGGILFLDEVGNMTEAHQAKLLRFLQERQYRRVGEPQTRPANVRVIAATNNISEIRDDLRARLEGKIIQLQTLEKRPDDRVAMINHFIHEAKITPDPEAPFLLYASDFIGDVRNTQSLSLNLDDFDYIQRRLVDLYAKRKDIKCKFADYDGFLAIVRSWYKTSTNDTMPWDYDIKQDFFAFVDYESPNGEVIAIPPKPDLLDAIVMVGTVDLDWSEVIRSYEYATLSHVSGLSDNQINGVLHLRKGSSFQSLFGFELNTTIPPKGEWTAEDFIYYSTFPGWIKTGRIFPDWIFEYLKAKNPSELETCKGIFFN